MIQHRPEFEFFLDRTSDFYLDEPHPHKPGVRMTHHYCFGIRENGSNVSELKQSYDVYDPDFPPPEYANDSSKDE